MTTSNSPDYIYYDLQVNNYKSSNTESPNLTFSESRSINFLSKPNDYHMSIVRFQLDTYSLPSFIADIEPNQSDPNKMIETITLEWETGGTVASGNPVNLVWVPTNKNIQTPAAPNTTNNGVQINSTQYYYGNSFRHYCDLVNTALKTATTALIAQVGGGTLTNLLPPFLKWNESTNCAELYAQELFYNWSRTNHVNIYFNRSLFARFNSMPAFRYGITSSLGRYYKMYMMDDNLTRTATINAQVYIKTSQEYSTISNWSPVSAIVFVSNTIGVYPNQTLNPITYNDGVEIKSQITPAFYNIISDIATNEMVYKPNLIYTPSAEYRYITLLSDQPMNNLDISVYWRDKQSGLLYPFILLSGASASIKILFKKKRINCIEYKT